MIIDIMTAALAILLIHPGFKWLMNLGYASGRWWAAGCGTQAWGTCSTSRDDLLRLYSMERWPWEMQQ